MHGQVNHGKIMAVKNGWALCPTCEHPRYLLHILPETTAENLELYCRRCKRIVKVNVINGQCYESPS